MSGGAFISTVKRMSRMVRTQKIHGKHIHKHRPKVYSVNQNVPEESRLEAGTLAKASANPSYSFLAESTTEEA
jgi:hypothetical protein